MKSGLPLYVACLGVCSNDILLRWMDENPSFATEIQKARRNHVKEQVSALNSNGPGSWQRNAWQLERMYPEHFAQKREPEASVNVKLEVSPAACAEISQSFRAFQARANEAVIDVKECHSDKPDSVSD